MASGLFAERRRFARVRIPNHALTLEATNHVRLLDINLRGVLLACPSGTSGPPRGDRAVLSVVLGTVPLTSPIEVRRGEPIVANGAAVGKRLAATFVDLNATNRQVVEQFLRKAVN